MIDKLLGAILGFGAASMLSKKDGNSFANGGEVLEYPFEYMGMRYNVTETSGMIDDRGRRLYEIDIKDYGKTNLRAPNYDLAKKYAQIEVEQIYDEENQFLKGGLLKKYKDLKMGTDIEMEHKETIHKFKKEGMSDREVAMMIAKDHLNEDPNYYKKLKSIEGK